MPEFNYDIALKGIQLHAPIGYFDWERVQLNYFEVDIEINLEPIPQSLSDQLDRTVDYGVLHQIIVEESKQPVALLETYCESVWNKILNKYPNQIRSGWIRIAKLQPPLPGRVNQSAVTLNFNR